MSLIMFGQNNKWNAMGVVTEKEEGEWIVNIDGWLYYTGRKFCAGYKEGEKKRYKLVKNINTGNSGGLRIVRHSAVCNRSWTAWQPYPRSLWKGRKRIFYPIIPRLYPMTTILGLSKSGTPGKVSDYILSIRPIIY